jgi:ribosomal protein S19
MSGRSQWKGPICNKLKLDKHLFPTLGLKVRRNETIAARLVDSSALVYNGKVLIKLSIDRKRVGFKFGIFSHTRKNYAVQDKKEKKKN